MKMESVGVGQDHTFGSKNEEGSGSAVCRDISLHVPMIVVFILLVSLLLRRS
jgi:hypothetical protein